MSSHPNSHEDDLGERREDVVDGVDVGEHRDVLGQGFPAEHTAVAERSPVDDGSPTTEFRLPSWCSNVTVERPYLEALPDGVAGETLVLDWIEFLLTRAGRAGTRDALAYYQSVGWISERVEESLWTYVEGFAVGTEAAASLGTDDHRQSLLFVAKLSATGE